MAGQTSPGWGRAQGHADGVFRHSQQSSGESSLVEDRPQLSR